MNNLTYFTTYINYYNTLIKPGYAVLVTGEWGSGKTHQIKNIFSENEMYYVSLFDISTVEDIYANVFYKMSPIKAFAKGAANGISDANVGIDAMTFGLGGIIGKVANAVIKEEVKTDKVIVFDDIERCSVDINSILGVINKYVEHHGCKVIAIAHDEKIKLSFGESKEKVIGQTLKVEPNIEDIFQYFIKEENKECIPNSIKKCILNTFLASNCKSMRILKHTLKDCLRLFDNIDEKYKQNHNVMDDVFTFFTAFSIAFRYGNIHEVDLTDRAAVCIKYHVSKDKTNAPAILKLSDSYKKNGLTIDLSRNTFNDETLINCLSKGYYDSNSINNDISANRFLESADSPSWLRLMNFDEKTSEETKGVLNDIEYELRNNKLTDPGIILHIFNLKLLMSLIQAHSLTYDEVFNQLHCYLKRLINDNLLPPSQNNKRFNNFRDSSHGYSYWIKDEYRHVSTKMFDLVDHFMIIANKKMYPQYIKEILESFTNIPCDFSELVAPGYNSQGKYAYIDILKSIKPHEFVEHWLNSPLANHQKISRGLKDRYSSGAIYNELSEELTWARKVNAILLHKAAKCTGFERLRLERLMCQI